jgi:hypothetical protein
MLWIEAQWMTVIALLVFGVCYMLTAAIFCLAAMLTDALPSDVRTAVRKAVKKHLDFIESKEWPAMASGRATLQSIAVGLAEAMTTLLSFTPAQSNQQLAQQRALVAIEQALEARRNRVLLSQAEIAPIQWIAIIVIAVLILITLAMVLVEHRLARAITMFIYSTAIAMCLVLLLVYDRPFGAGGFVIRPTVYQAVGARLSD